MIYHTRATIYRGMFLKLGLHFKFVNILNTIWLLIMSQKRDVDIIKLNIEIYVC